jgi:hypothetical protein
MIQAQLKPSTNNKNQNKQMEEMAIILWNKFLRRGGASKKSRINVKINHKIITKAKTKTTRKPNIQMMRKTTSTS